MLNDGQWWLMENPIKMDDFEEPICYWLVVRNMFYFSMYWECHQPNWRTHIFQRGRYTTNQTNIMIYDIYVELWVCLKMVYCTVTPFPMVHNQLLMASPQFCAVSCLLQAASYIVPHQVPNCCHYPTCNSSIIYCVILHLWWSVDAFRHIWCCTLPVM